MIKTAPSPLRIAALIGFVLLCVLVFTIATVAKVVGGGQSSTTALTGSTEEAQFQTAAIA